MLITRRDFLTETAAAGLLSSGASGQPDHSSHSAKLFTNGAIYIDAGTKVVNLLVRGDTVAGYNIDPSAQDGEVVDLGGAALYPGFNDSHVHLMETGLFFHLGANLTGTANSGQIAGKLQDHLKAKPDLKAVLGAGFSFEDYDAWSLADLEKIDAVTGNRIVFLGDKLGHNAILNTYTMQQTGITAQTPVPKGGTMGIEDGKLTGMLRESAMNLPGSKVFEKFDDADVKAGTEIMARNWARMGYTAIVDLMGAPGIRLMRPELFKELEQEGKLPLRVNYCYTLFNLNDVASAVAYMDKDTDRVRFVGGKIFVDGAFAGGQAWTSWENELKNHGAPQIFTTDEGGIELNLNRIVAEAERHGMNMHYHAQGDLAIQAILDALGQVVATSGKLRAVHTIIHLAFPTDAQIERIAGFNGSVVTTMQPGFWPVESDTQQYYGARAAKPTP